jgi:hemoglobin-like flavoprotein
MNSDHIQLIRETFPLVARRPDLAALLFYKRLFEIDPSLRPLFRPDIEEQGRKLMQMLSAAVHLLEQPESLTPVLEALGRKHVGYGVRDEHYDTVGEALLWTLHSALGDFFTPNVREAWASLYGLIAATMKRAAAEGSLLKPALSCPHQTVAAAR